MSSGKKVAGNVLTEEGWVRGELHFEGRVIDINGVSTDPAENSDDVILPGFIDLHVHGGGGRDIMDAGDAVHVISRMHARHDDDLADLGLGEGAGIDRPRLLGTP